MNNLSDKILEAIQELRQRGKNSDEFDLWSKIAPYLTEDEQDKLLKSLNDELSLIST